MKLLLELSIEETQLILNALAKLPYEVSAQLIEKVKTEGDKAFIPKKD